MNKKPQNQTSNNILSVFMLLGGIFGLVALGKVPPTAVGDFGTGDFIEYWSAFQLLLSGDNFYDSEKMQAVQLAVGRDYPVAMMMWNPPWTLTLLTPVLLWQGFFDAAHSFLIVNLLLALGTGLLVCLGTTNRKQAIAPCAFAALTFFPVYECLQAGQVSLLVAFGIAGAYWGFRREKYLAAGAFLSLLTIKFHLAYLLLVAAAFLTLRLKLWKVIWGFLGAMTLIVAVNYIQSPKAIYYWITSLNQAQSAKYLMRISDWQSASLTSWIRTLVSALDLPGSTTWPLVAVPGICALLLAGVIVWKKDRKFELTLALPHVLCISVITAPMAWSFDFSLLVIVQVILVAKFFDTNRSSKESVWLVISILGLQAAYYAFQFVGFNHHHQQVWFPLAMWLLWSLVERHLRQRPSGLATGGTTLPGAETEAPGAPV